ncbi:hypothetical protein BgiBS90_001845 [Biomphalaria glabrata]|nr:hypothetical protein BgiBS90_001845 [Biomphalaria glabrata]
MNINRQLNDDKFHNCANVQGTERAQVSGSRTIVTALPYVQLFGYVILEDECQSSVISICIVSAGTGAAFLRLLCDTGCSSRVFRIFAYLPRSVSLMEQTSQEGGIEI